MWGSEGVVATVRVGNGDGGEGQDALSTVEPEGGCGECGADGLGVVEKDDTELL
jgi:hypothetical protein